MSQPRGGRQPPAGPSPAQRTHEDPRFFLSSRYVSAQAGKSEKELFHVTPDHNRHPTRPVIKGSLHLKGDIEPWCYRSKARGGPNP